MQEHWSGLPCPPPGILPTQGLNPGLPHHRWILYHLSHQRSLRILEWVACPFSSVVFQTQESNQDLLHCRQILYQLSYQGTSTLETPKSPLSHYCRHKCQLGGYRADRMLPDHHDPSLGGKGKREDASVGTENASTFPKPTLDSTKFKISG